MSADRLPYDWSKVALSLVLPLALLSFVTSCSDPHEEALNQPCDQAKLPVCDVTGRECQARTFRRTECARKAETASVPKVNIISENELREVLSQPDSTDDAVQREYEDRIASETFHLLGFLAADVESAQQQDLEFLVSQILAFYDPTVQVVTIVEHDERSELGTEQSVLTLAHEFAHAQQDQAFNLQAHAAAFPKTADGGMARHSLPEGDATLAEFLVQQKPSAEVPLALWQSTWDASLTALFDRAADPDFPYNTAARYFPYIVGADFVSQVWFDRGTDGIAELFAVPRRTSWAFLAGPASDEPALHELFVIDSDDVNKRVWAIDELGSFAYYALLGRAANLALQGLETYRPGDDNGLIDGDVESWRELALAWRGDKVQVFADEQAQGVVVLWRIALDPASPPHSLASLQHLAALPGDQSGSRRAQMLDDSTLLIAAAQAGVDLQPWVDLAVATTRDKPGRSHEANQAKPLTARAWERGWIFGLPNARICPSP